MFARLLRKVAHPDIVSAGRTNLPQEVMGYPGFPFESDEGRSFVGHKVQHCCLGMCVTALPARSSLALSGTRVPQAVLKYLIDFANAFELEPLVRYNTSVLSVKRVTAAGDTAGDPAAGWEVIYKDARKAASSTTRVDAVVVCNGHYSKPFCKSSIVYKLSTVPQDDGVTVKRCGGQ